jgi:hypothetical protein
MQILEKYKTKTTDPKKILTKILHASNNEVDCILGKTTRGAPLEPEEVRKLEALTRIVTSAISTQISLEKHERASEDVGDDLKITAEQIQQLTLKAGEK